MRIGILVSLLLLTACSKEAAPAAVEAAPSKAPAEAEALESEQYPKPWENWGPLGLALITDGEAPLRKLRRSFEKGSTAVVDLEVQSTSGPQTLSSMYTLSLETKETAENGTKAVVGFRIDNASGSISPRWLKGLRGHYSADSLGGIHDLKITPPEGADEAMLRLIANLEQALPPVLGVPLPEVEVGQGAEWSVHLTVQEGVIPVAQHSVYELTKVDGAKVEVSLKLETASKAPAREGAMRFQALEGAGSGAHSLDLSKLVADNAHHETSTLFKYVQPADNQKFVVRIKTSTKLTAR